MGTFSRFQHNSKCIQLVLCSPTCHNLTKLKIGGFIISQHNPAPFTKQKVEIAMHSGPLNCSFPCYTGTVPHLSRTIGLSGEPASTCSMVLILQTMLDQQDKRVHSWQWIELNQLEVFFCVMEKKGKNKKNLGFKRSEAIKCLNIKKKTPTSYQKQWWGRK